MKKIILFILVIGQISFAVAQSLVVTGNTSFTGDLVTQIAHHLDIKNTSVNTITIECQKTNLTLPSGGASFYCFAGNCYSASSTNPSSSAVLAPGQEISFNNSPPDTDAHSGYYDAFGASGIAEVQYCFYDVNNTTDETCVTITYDCSASSLSWDCDGQGNCSDPGTGLGAFASLSACQGNCSITTSIDDLTEPSEISNFYPNPANGLTHFTFNGTKAQLKIIDILGNEIKVLQIEEPGVKKIDLTDMSKGIYFGKLVKNNKVTTIKKLIVK